MSIESNARTKSNFQPGALTRDGFLGKDERAIQDIVREDETALVRLGANREAVADFLQSLIDQGKKGLEGRVVCGNWTVQIHWARGLLPCPFGEPKLHPKITAVAFEKSSGRTLRFSQLTVHLIREHGFFEGRGSAFRVEPEQAVELMRCESIPNQEGI
jgi:hypothetical protein